MTHRIFEDRTEAGRRLTAKLCGFKSSDAIILAIPRGGVPVATATAIELGLEWNVIVARKLPIPSNPEAGFGAMAANGPVVLNEAMLHGLRLRPGQVDDVIDRVRAEIDRRTAVYSEIRPCPSLTSRTVIILDDGLASGYTMLAAIKSVRAHDAAKVIAAAPVASKSAAASVENAADECMFELVSPAVPFAVADFYLQWRDLTDEDIVPLLRTR